VNSIDNDVARLQPAVATTRSAARRRSELWWTGLGAGALWLAAAAMTEFWPDADDWARTGQFAVFLAGIGGLIIAAVIAEQIIHRPSPWLRRRGPWLVALAVFLGLWEVVQGKLELLPRPFFGVPQNLLDVYLSDYPRLGDSLIHSLGLLATGYTSGVAIGFVVGVGLGWSRNFGYWVHPLLRLIGPLPAVALIPIAFIVLPSSWAASNFLIAFAAGVPVTVLTWSGVAAVNVRFYDVALTLGATPRFLVLRVAIPAALPSVFVGLFMGLCASFSVLVVAEMLGVKAGLGWYLQWAQGWAAYDNMYAALLLMALMCSTLITILFKIRDRLLGWQQGTVKW
jgi:NitT/TauT family transport system permease protein